MFAIIFISGLIVLQKVECGKYFLHDKKEN